MKFKLIFKKEIIVKAKSIEEAHAKVDNGEIVRAGFKTNLTGFQYDFYELPEFTLEPVNKKEKEM